ncbi:relaxase/mobilization nuclease domain-containing protein [Flavobacterium turcicum]|uniref:Relaxase/mobilization nuclease domain-containing protein n=1 Tax=Flavobacterium turcicum TaxID=2764718 RepID=A0ABR7JEC5_9FLAO|nr:relaxase/mobilization nuclease domain-containing protein [Flavobacterium turcicum]MBC5862830.1 relaxase/mobilization nuclease domain-containing protein [Flavobacterium turcicum]NHL01562.1 relaxase/mobilization nuclease domain-containing protein [Flavobacterium turcicum]
MVAVIKTSHSIQTIFNYNENKVKQGVAECIGAGNYPIDVDKMNTTIKLNRFLKQLELNENVKRNSVHISLNFDPSENYSKEKLMAIANTYMDKIGFGNQPYLIYQHHDAGHPHIHLVTINIESDGKRIDLHHLAIIKSEPARKEIEENFGLVKAQGAKKREAFELKPITTSKIQYGKIESKKAITNVLDGVLSSYKYANLSELNAVLLQYNVLADRGAENSRIFKSNGLVYRILDENGKPIGVPIKASDFYNKPTLKFLEEKFIQNKTISTSNKNRIKNAIDLIFLGKKTTLSELALLLQKEGINTVLRKNSEGLIYGITYVDHSTKCVINGSTLGKQYSAKAIQERCGFITASEQKKKVSIYHKQMESESKIAINAPSNINETTDSNTAFGKVLKLLTQPENPLDYVPKQLKGKRKKKKRKGQSDHQ